MVDDIAAPRQRDRRVASNSQASAVAPPCGAIRCFARRVYAYKCGAALNSIWRHFTVTRIRGSADATLRPTRSACPAGLIDRAPPVGPRSSRPGCASKACWPSLLQRIQVHARPAGGRTAWHAVGGPANHSFNAARHRFPYKPAWRACCN